MSSSWQDMCVASATRSLDDFDTINYCTSGILVFFFVATGLACGCRYWQWRRLSSATKAELWELYGVFCALGSLGCAAGFVACLCLMLGNKYSPPTCSVEHPSLHTRMLRLRDGATGSRIEQPEL
jgi:hypothetical protein